MIVILPDPTTRECRQHRGTYYTDTRPCFECMVDDLIGEMLIGMNATLQKAMSASVSDI